ncbi:class I SAM-dependent methyltransferase [Gordonia sputi]|uniref:class I SAM-dependent methyltransferase n=1 Tax=Gordonia sputi TaxID=36823 RepID=UPI002270F656|nr:class I SAM-dependent methyltransferase [Gordonia sputi]
MTLTSTRHDNSTSHDEYSASPLIDVIKTGPLPCVIEYPDGRQERLSSDPLFTVRFVTPDGLETAPTQLAVATAYMHGDIDVTGDFEQVMAARDILPSGNTAQQAAKFLWDLIIASPTTVNRKAIDSHYTLGDDFYHTFIDSHYRFYSQCIFDSPDDTLEQAAEHKLERMYSALQLGPGDRLLDIGGGWGGVGLYCAPRGVHVTAVTLAEDSAAYMRDLYRRRDLDVDVVHTDYLDYQPDRPFDHIVMYGVIEHLPNYAQFCAKTWELLRPGGRLYLDGSASIEKYAMTGFTRKYIWPGHHTFMSLPAIQHALLRHGFDILETRNETNDYALTMRHWATRFDAARPDIEARWGQETYRKFRIYLWAGAHALRTNRLQAYHVLAERRDDPGPRPSLITRGAASIASAIA